MASERREALRRAYGLSAGPERRSPEDVLFWRFRLESAALPGYVPQRVQRAAVFGAAANLSAWQPPTPKARGGVVTIETFEAASRPGAVDVLLELLGTFQGPVLARLEGADAPGDVAFAAGNGAVVFTRGNLAVAVRDGGGDAPVQPLARTLDAFLLERPEPSPAGPRLEARAGSAAAGQPVPLLLEAAGDRGREVWFKLFTGSGTLRLEQGRPAYVAAGAGAGEVVVYALDTEGYAARTTLRIEG